MFLSFFKESATFSVFKAVKKTLKARMSYSELYHLPKTGGRFMSTHFYSVTKSFAPTWYSCKSTSS